MDVYLRGIQQGEVPADGSEPRVFAGQVQTGVTDADQFEENKSGKKDEEYDDTYVILEDGERVHISWLEQKKIKKEDGRY